MRYMIYAVEISLVLPQEVIESVFGIADIRIDDSNFEQSNIRSKVNIGILSSLKPCLASIECQDK